MEIEVCLFMKMVDCKRVYLVSGDAISEHGGVARIAAIVSRFSHSKPFNVGVTHRDLSHFEELRGSISARIE